LPSFDLKNSDRNEERMSGLTLFGLVAATAMMLCYAAEDRAPIYIFGFAAACMMGSLYGFLQGAWPFGIVEAIWSAYALRRWWLQKRNETSK
jgi:hypothetical protein